MMRNRSAGKSYKMATGGTESADDEFSVQVVMRRPQRANTQAGPVGGGIFNSLQRRKKSTRTGGPCEENNIISLFLILIWAGKRRGCGLLISHIPASAGRLKLFETHSQALIPYSSSKSSNFHAKFGQKWQYSAKKS